jgi:hypothetical protein
MAWLYCVYIIFVLARSIPIGISILILSVAISYINRYKKKIELTMMDKIVYVSSWISIIISLVLSVDFIMRLLDLNMNDFNNYNMMLVRILPWILMPILVVVASCFYFKKRAAVVIRSDYYSVF